MMHQEPSRRIGSGCLTGGLVFRFWTFRITFFVAAWFACSLIVPVLFAQQGRGNGTESATNSVQVVAIQGTNWWIAPSGAADWVMASTRMPQSVRTGDRIRTGRHTRLFLRTPNLGVIQIPPLSTIEISP